MPTLYMGSQGRLMLALLLCLWAIPASADRLITSGFEFNSVTALAECEAVAGTFAVNTTADRSGVYGMHVASLVSGTAEVCRHHWTLTPSATSEFFIRVYIKIVTLPGAADSTIFCSAQNTVSACSIRVELQDNGTLVVSDEDGDIGTSSIALGVGNWYRLELRVDGEADTTTANDDIELLVDGVSQVSATNRDIDLTHGALFLGGNLNSEATTVGEWYLDDVALNDINGSTQNTYPGAGAIVMLPVDGDGNTANRGTQGTDYETCTNNDASCGAGTGGTAWQMVDDNPTPDDVTTHIRLLTTSANCTDAPVLLFSTASLTSRGTSEGVAIDSNDTITFVSTRVRHGSDGAANRNHRALMFSDATCVQAGADMTEGNTSYQWDNSGGPFSSRLVRTTDPDGDATWTLSAVDAIQVGVRSGNDVTPQSQITMLAAEVEYVAVANASAGCQHAMLMGLGKCG